MNHTQSEQELENKLIADLQTQGYDFVKIEDEADLLKNFKKQLEIHNKKSLNGKTLSDTEFERVLNHLNKWNTFEKAHLLRGRMHLLLDDGEKAYIRFMNCEKWCQNEYQVTNQITMEGTYVNRYDVTILINGLPLVQIELKKRGLELKEAFNQTKRYQKHSYAGGFWLFQYIQVFVISNGVDTKYYANNGHKNKDGIGNFKQTFFWSDEKNKTIRNLEKFTQIFLEKCHVSKMIAKYIVLNQSEKIAMILRPYQFYATEAIISRVQSSNENGYIWHTTGSGKTLTSFKTSQILEKLPEVAKVVFVVDRKDLDYQTTTEFNSYSDGSVDGTKDTKSLVKQFLSNDTNLIVTTIQKLNTAISKTQYKSQLSDFQDKKIVFIFDECHRSQFWETHKKITEFFNKSQLFGFTWTPILKENHNNLRTTESLFVECLHRYVITDAINDNNVLRFSVEYINTFKTKKEFEKSWDEQVENIDTKEIFDHPERIQKVVDYVIKTHPAKTHSKKYTAMMCVSSKESLMMYYDAFKKANHDLKIATIFSYGTNEDETDFEIESLNQHSRDALESYMWDYNEMFGTSYSTKDSKLFYEYYRDIAKKVKEKQIDLLLVVNMFLTGFDSKSLNTLYVDKNLKYHGLIQAFSRTNRILDEKKSQGNIVCFRNLQQNVEDAVKLFSNPDAEQTVLLEPYETYLKYFSNALEKLYIIAPSIESVDDLLWETQKAEFVKAFRDVYRILNVLETFQEFDFHMLDIDAQTLADYRSKYLELYRQAQTEVEKASILNEIDFELELITTDIINVDYIIGLLGTLRDSDEEHREKLKQSILSTLAWEPKLQSKKALIEKFIETHLMQLPKNSDVNSEFEKFLIGEKAREFQNICKENNLNPEKLAKVFNNYNYTGKTPLDSDITDSMNKRPGLLSLKKTIDNIKNIIISFVEKYDD